MQSFTFMDSHNQLQLLRWDRLRPIQEGSDTINLTSGNITIISSPPPKSDPGLAIYSRFNLHVIGVWLHYSTHLDKECQTTCAYYCCTNLTTCF